MRNYLTLTIIFSILFMGCSKDDDQVGTGDIVFHFDHSVLGSPIEFDQMKYTNAAANQYEVSEIQWFISDITLSKDDGTSFLLDDNNEFAHYVDTDLAYTHEWKKSGIEAGDYNSITMTFGIKGEKNIPGAFPNPPESDMIWPYHMGGDNGGYHYMKLNGFWIDTVIVRQPFNFHLGVGKELDQFGDPIYFQNWIEEELPFSAFSISAGETKMVTIEMDVANWFNGPYIYDHNEYGGKIMDNQEAMKKGCENGRIGVFSVSSVQSQL